LPFNRNFNVKINLFFESAITFEEYNYGIVCPALLALVLVDLASGALISPLLMY